MRDAEGQTKTFGGKLGGFAKTVGKVAVGAVVGLTVAMVGAFAATKKVTEGFDVIAKNSRKMGVSTDYYQEMEYWASQNGVSHNNMEKSMQRLNQRIGEARAGNEKYSDALQELGIDMGALKDGTLSTEEAMTKSIKALSEMENGQDKAALASELFGTKLAQELMPALDAGALSIEDAQKQAEKLGLVIGEDTLNAAEKFNDTWDDLTRMVGAFGQKAIAKLMPFFQKMMDWIINNMPLIQKIFEKVFGVINTVMSAIGNFIRDTVIPALVELWAWIEPHLPMLQSLFEQAFGFAKEVIAELVEAIIDVTGWFQEHWAIIEPILIGIAAGALAFATITGAIALWSAVVGIATGVGAAFGAVLAFITSPIGLVVIAIGLLVAAGVLLYKNWDKVKEFLGKTWNWIKDTSTKIFNGLLDFFKKWGTTILAILTGPIGLLVLLISRNWDWIKNTTSNIFNGIKDFFAKWGTTILAVLTGPIGLLVLFISRNWDAIKNTTSRVFNAVKDAMTKPIEKAKETISNIIDKVKGFFTGMKLTFPSIKMPKLPSFKLDGKFSLAPPSVPKLKINWNKDGGIFDSPTIFGTNKGLQGVGEAGPEAILPLTSSVLGGIGKGIAKTMQGGNGAQGQQINIQPSPIYLDGQHIADVTFDIIDGRFTGQTESQAYMRGERQ